MLKKKILVILISIITFSCFSSVSYAISNGVVYLTSEQEKVEKGDEIEITVNLKDAKTAACNFNICFDEAKTEYISTIKNTNLISNRLSYVWFDTLGGEGAKEGEIEKFKFRAKENGVATFTIDGEFYNESGQLIETTFKEARIQIGKEENNVEEKKQEVQENTSKSTNLEVLAIENILLNPPFEASHTNYEIEVPYYTESLNIFAAPEDENAKIEIIGKDNLKEGSNLITVTVKATNGLTEKIYTIKANKRNLEEEKQYEDEQSKQKEKLENAYKIEKTSANVKFDNEKMSDMQDIGKQSNRKWSRLVIGIIVDMFM